MGVLFFRLYFLYITLTRKFENIPAYFLIIITIKVISLKYIVSLWLQCSMTSFNTMRCFSLQLLSFNVRFWCLVFSSLFYIPISFVCSIIWWMAALVFIGMWIATYFISCIAFTSMLYNFAILRSKILKFKAAKDL